MTSNNDALRPTTWDSYIGQQALKERLRINIESALARQTRLDHVLLVGPAGSGKTSLAHIIAQEMSLHIYVLQCPFKSNVLSQIIREFDGIIFLDEIHLIPPKQQHDLLPLIEDNVIRTPSGIPVPIGELTTIIAATTEPEKLLGTLFDRFMIRPSFAEYSQEEMGMIVAKMADMVDLDIPEVIAKTLGKAAGGVPRNARSLIFMARDLVATGHAPTAERILEACRVTEDGLQENHLNYLATLAKMGGTGGLDPLSNHLRLPKSVLMDLERLLVAQNLITYGKTGRALTHTGYQVAKKFSDSV